MKNSNDDLDFNISNIDRNVFMAKMTYILRLRKMSLKELSQNVDLNIQYFYNFKARVDQAKALFRKFNKISEILSIDLENLIDRKASIKVDNNFTNYKDSDERNKIARIRIENRDFNVSLFANKIEYILSLKQVSIAALAKNLNMNVNLFYQLYARNYRTDRDTLILKNIYKISSLLDIHPLTLVDDNKNILLDQEVLEIGLKNILTESLDNLKGDLDYIKYSHNLQASKKVEYISNRFLDLIPQNLSESLNIGDLTTVFNLFKQFIESTEYELNLSQTFYCIWETYNFYKKCNKNTISTKEFIPIVYKLCK